MGVTLHSLAEEYHLDISQAKILLKQHGIRVLVAEMSIEGDKLKNYRRILSQKARLHSIVGETVLQVEEEHRECYKPTSLQSDGEIPPKNLFTISRKRKSRKSKAMWHQGFGTATIIFICAIMLSLIGLFMAAKYL